MTTDHPPLATLADYVSTALPADEVPAVRRHLAECERCAAQASAVAQVPAVLSEAANVAEPMPDAVWRKIEDALRAETESAQPAPARLDERRHSAPVRPSRSRSLLVAALTVAVLGAGGAALHELRSGNQASSAMSQADGSATRSQEPENPSGPSGATAGNTAPSPATRTASDPMIASTSGRRRPLSPRNLSSYATQLSAVGKSAASATGSIRSTPCARPTPTNGSTIVTVRRWKGTPAVVVVTPTTRQVSVFDCRTASVRLYSTTY